MEKEFEFNGLKLFYEETGPADGHPVILMHGWGCDHSTVKSIASILDSNLRVFNFDLPGHGKTPEPSSVWGVEDFTVMMEDFIKKNDLKNPSVIGHSFGGRVAIILGSRNPLNKIILVDAAGVKPKRSLQYYWKVYSFKTAKKLIPLLLGKDKGKKIIDEMRSKKGSADYRNSSPMMRAIMSRCVNEDLKKHMPFIKAPVLLVWGENDTATPLNDARIMKKLIPDAGLVSFPGCGHYSFLDNPFGFKAVVKEFFKDELKNN